MVDWPIAVVIIALLLLTLLLVILYILVCHCRKPHLQKKSADLIPEHHLHHYHPTEYIHNVVAIEGQDVYLDFEEPPILYLSEEDIGLKYSDSPSLSPKSPTDLPTLAILDTNQLAELENMQWTGRYAPRLARLPEAVRQIHAIPASPVDSHLLLPPQSLEDQGKYTIVFDMDETLLHSKEHLGFLGNSPTNDVITLRFPEGSLYSVVRPHAREILRTLGPLCELVLWTAGQGDYAESVMENVDSHHNIKHFIYRDDRWFTFPNYIKSLKRLGRPMDKVLLIDNTEYVCIADVQNSIVIKDYLGSSSDRLLVTLEKLLMSMFESGLSVPQYLSQCRSRSDLAFWGGFYRLTQTPSRL